MTAPPDPVPYTAARRGERTGLAVAALVCGLLALILCWIWPAGLVLGAIAVTFGVIVRHLTSADPSRPGRAQGLAGLVIGALGLVGSLTFMTLQFTGVFPGDDKPEHVTCHVYRDGFQCSEVAAAPLRDAQQSSPSAQRDVFVSVNKCEELILDQVEASGTLTNLTSRKHKFRLSLFFLRGGKVVGRGVATTRWVRPGESGDWNYFTEVTQDGGALSCRAKAHAVQ